MANHVRQQIREALGTVLSGLTTTAARVYQSRIYPLEDGDLPCLLVATDQESITPQTSVANPVLERQLKITVRAVAKTTSNLDDMLDTMIKEVETAVNATEAANTLGGLVTEITLENIEIELSAEAEKPVGQALMTFNATYYTQAAAPDISI